MYHLRKVNSLILHSLLFLIDIFLPSFHTFFIQQIFLFWNLSICKVPHWDSVLSACARNDIKGTNCILKSKHIPCWLGHGNTVVFSTTSTSSGVNKFSIFFISARTTIFVSVFPSSPPKKTRTMDLSPSCNLLRLATPMHSYLPTTSTHPVASFFHLCKL